MSQIFLMVGHPRSGGTLVASLLNAHPAMSVADDFDLLDHVAAGFDKESMVRLLARAATRDTARASKAPDSSALHVRSVLGPAVVGTDPVKVGPVTVIGESNTGATTRQIAAAPALLDELERVMDPAHVKLLHLVSNPFDVIEVMAIREQLTIHDAADRFFADCSMLEGLRDRMPVGQMLTMRYEDVVLSVIRELRAVCEWLGVGVSNGYLRACADVVDPPEAAGRDVSWSAGEIRSVSKRCKEYPYLEGYIYQSGYTGARVLMRDMHEMESA